MRRSPLTMPTIADAKAKKAAVLAFGDAVAPTAPTGRDHDVNNRRDDQ
jgi:hypothetical protein